MTARQSCDNKTASQQANRPFCIPLRYEEFIQQGAKSIHHHFGDGKKDALKPGKEND